MKIRLRNLSIVMLSLLIGFSMSACSSSSDSTGPSGTYTVSGTVTMPAVATGRTYDVWVTTGMDLDPTVITVGTVGTGTTFTYTLNNVPAGDYFVVAIVYIVGDSATHNVVNGDYAGVTGTAQWDGLSDPGVSVTKLTVNANKTVDINQVICAVCA